MKVTKNKAFNYIYLGVQLASLVFFILMLFDANKLEITILFLPFAFLVVNMMFFTNYVQKNVHLTKLLVLVLYFVRLSLLPFLYLISGESRLYKGNVFMSSDSLQKAFYLMVYEYFVVQLVIFLHTKVKFKRHKLEARLIQKQTYNFFPVILMCMTAFVVVVYIFFPEVRGTFKTLLRLNEVDFTMSGYLASTNQIGSIRRIIATLFNVVFAMIRILLPVYFLVREKKKGKSAILLFFISVSIQFVFITSTFAQSIVAALTIVLLFGYLYPEKKKLLSLMIGITTVGIIALYFIVRYSVGSMYSDNTSFASYIARIVSAYFTGIENVAGCFQIEKGYEFETAVSDIIGTIPFNSTFFGGWGGDKFQKYFNSTNNSYGQISPAIGSGYYHFGWLFSPIYVVLMLKLSLYHCDKAQKDSNPWRYAVNTFCCIVFALGLVMYNESIAFSWYLGWGVLMLLVLKFTNKDEFL